LYLTSLQSSELVKLGGALPSSSNGVSEKWGEGGRRGKFWGREEGWKILGQGKRMCFWFIPKTAWTTSSWTGALVAAGSLQPLPTPFLALSIQDLMTKMLELTLVFQTCRHFNTLFLGSASAPISLPTSS
jgi:hypothetical protein